MRRWLVVFLAVAAAVLSFDALRAHALLSGVIPEQAIAPREWLAALWALVIDAAAAAGVLGVQHSRRDWRAWVMLTLAFAASVGFQVWTPPTALARTVPPVALFLAVLVLKLPARGAAPPAASQTPNTAEQVGEGGALPGALPAIAAVWNEGMSGAQLARALTDRGVQITDRDARRLLAVLRADAAPPLLGNGAGPRQEARP